jgi:Family of unknown function (DUF6516)
LTTQAGVVILSNTKAELLIRQRIALSATAFVDIVVWRVPKPVRGSNHDIKYRLALVVDRVCVMRYDNEAGKGDHRHVRNSEQPYQFIDVDTLLADFWRDVDKWSN